MSLHQTRKSTVEGSCNLQGFYDSLLLQANSSFFKAHISHPHWQKAICFLQVGYMPSTRSGTSCADCSH